MRQLDNDIIACIRRYFRLASGSPLETVMPDDTPEGRLAYKVAAAVESILPSIREDDTLVCYGNNVSLDEGEEVVLGLALEYITDVEKRRFKKLDFEDCEVANPVSLPTHIDEVILPYPSLPPTAERSALEYVIANIANLNKLKRVTYTTITPRDEYYGTAVPMIDLSALHGLTALKVERHLSNIPKFLGLEHTGKITIDLSENTIRDITDAPELFRAQRDYSKQPLTLNLSHNPINWTNIHNGQAVRDLRNIGITVIVDDAYIPEKRPSVYEQLLRAGIPERALDDVRTALDSVNREYQGVHKTTDRTFSWVVLDTVVLEGEPHTPVKLYVKLDTNKQIVEREATYMNHAWQYHLMRPITPKLFGWYENKDEPVAALVTYGTENTALVSPTDNLEYLISKKRLFKAYAEINGRKSEELLCDPFMTDVFNRAIAHTYMRDYVEREIYHKDVRPVVVSFEELVERAKVTTNSDLLEKLMDLQSYYKTAQRRFDDIGEGHSRITVVHFDARQANIFSPHQPTRPIGDFGFARVGLPEYDLARLESGHDAEYAAAYAYFRNHLEQERGANFELDTTSVAHLQQRVEPLSFMNAVRTLSSKLSRDCIPEAQMYLGLALRLKGTHLQ